MHNLHGSQISFNYAILLYAYIPEFAPANKYSVQQKSHSTLHFRLASLLFRICPRMSQKKIYGENWEVLQARCPSRWQANSVRALKGRK